MALPPLCTTHWAWHFLRAQKFVKLMKNYTKLHFCLLTSYFFTSWPLKSLWKTSILVSVQPPNSQTMHLWQHLTMPYAFNFWYLSWYYSFVQPLSLYHSGILIHPSLRVLSSLSSYYKFLLTHTHGLDSLTFHFLDWTISVFKSRILMSAWTSV